MSKLKLIIENKAEDDIKLIVRYLDNEKVALKVLTNFNKVFDIICLHPNLGFTKEEFIYRDVRLFVVKKKFLIVYKELDSCIHILRVLNTCQDICFKL